MANILVLTTDLPYFPGKNGHDFFNLRHLAQTHRVGVAAPLYESCPAAGVQNLRASIDKLYLWPTPAPNVQLFVNEKIDGTLPIVRKFLPAWLRRRLLFRLLGIAGQPQEASYLALCILSNCAPQLLSALHEQRWQATVVLQSSLAPWLEYLPHLSAKIIYFHDIRSDYLARSPEPEIAATVRAVHVQEKKACLGADAIGVVSMLDLERAKRLLPLPDTHEVAPIPIDTAYFTPKPVDWKKDPRKIILFTGHLSHPPNVDAVVYFLRDIWPLVLAQRPDSIFQVVGMLPHARIVKAISENKQVELHSNVPDIRPYFWNADAYVIPMRFGGGVRQKIFEAWAMKLPVVSTTMGAEGTYAADGRNCWLADEPAGIATKLVSILSSQHNSSFIENAGREVEQKNSIIPAASAFEKLAVKGIAHRSRKPFRLLYDLRWMEIGKAGGVEQMTHELIHSISCIDHQNHYRFYTPENTYNDWDLDTAFKCKARFSDNKNQKKEAWLSLFTNQLSRSFSLQQVLTPEMRTLKAWHKMDFELVHSMVSYIHPDLHAFPHILTMHDLQHLAMPQFLAPKDLQVREQLYRESAERAEHIIAISEYTRQDIHNKYNIPLEKITTIWNIPSRTAWMPLSPVKRHQLLNNLGIDSPFLFFPAHCWPHKNHTRLVEAFASIQNEIPPSTRLILTGRTFADDHPAQKIIEKYSLQNRVTHLGYRSPLEIKALYDGCLALAFPSLFEGFGMPVAEAMICGKAIICSNTTSLPEIAGDAALTFDPENISDIARCVREIINNSTCREALSAAACKRRNLFSARMSAIKTLSLYHKVHADLYGT